MREEDESLPVYLRRYCDWLRSDWSALGAEEKASVCDHILNNDRPETFSVLKALAQAAGLGDATAVARYGWHRVICWQSTKPGDHKVFRGESYDRMLVTSEVRRLPSVSGKKR